MKRDLSDGVKLGSGRSPARTAFTLVELMVSTVIFILILGLVVTIMSGASSMWLRHRNQSAAFESANAAYETLTRTLGQAVLNTYWEVKNQSYGRASELHFVMGPTTTLLGSGSAQEYPGSAAFFQAILGRPSASSLRRLPLLLNNVGYFVRFDTGPDNPDFLDGIAKDRYRFRLYQWLQPTEDLGIFEATSGPQSGERSWFRDTLAAGGMDNTAVLAENVISLVLMAEYPDSSGSIVPTYLYDSRSGSPAATEHQLPPRIRVIMAVMDEASATRLAAKYNSTPPPIYPETTWFQDPQDFSSDLDQWESRLKSVRPRIDYRIFASTVIIQNAKWSINP